MHKVINIYEQIQRLARRSERARSRTHSLQETSGKCGLLDGQRVVLQRSASGHSAPALLIDTFINQAFERGRLLGLENLLINPAAPRGVLLSLYGGRAVIAEHHDGFGASWS